MIEAIKMIAFIVIFVILSPLIIVGIAATAFVATGQMLYHSLAGTK